MAFLSFALTTREFLENRKTVTRRFWKPRHLVYWQRWYDEGHRLHDAWDKVPFAKGKRIGQFILTQRPYLQPLSEMTADDLLAEGGMCDTLDEFCALIGYPPESVPAVVPFMRVEHFRDCPDCDGRWAHCKNRRSGIETLWHVDSDGIVSTGNGCVPF